MAAQKCTRCGKTAYDAESVKYDKYTYHTTCFKCPTCFGQLSVSSIAQLNGELYHKDCFLKVFKEKGGSYDAFKDKDEVERSRGRPEPTPEEKAKPKPKAEWGHCAKCHQGFLDPDFMEVNGEQYHPKCFQCFTCKKPFGENPCSVKDGKYFCNEKCAEDSTCSACKTLILETVVTAASRKWHQRCFICSKCSTPLKQKGFTVNVAAPTEPLCASCGQ